MKVEIREKVKKILLIIGAVLGALLSTIGTLLYFSIKWMFKTWTNLTMDELVYHLTAPLEGTNDGMIQEYLDVCAVPAILMLLLVVILFIAWRTKKRWYVVMGASIIVPIIVSGVSVHGAWNELDVAPLERQLEIGDRVYIGKNVWIGRNVCIMPGVKICDGAVIGANSVVTHDIPEKCIAVGAPAKVIREVREEG